MHFSREHEDVAFRAFTGIEPQFCFARVKFILYTPSLEIL